MPTIMQAVPYASGVSWFGVLFIEYTSQLTDARWGGWGVFLICLSVASLSTFAWISRASKAERDQIYVSTLAELLSGSDAPVNLRSVRAEPFRSSGA